MFVSFYVFVEFVAWNTSDQASVELFKGTNTVNNKVRTEEVLA